MWTKPKIKKKVKEEIPKQRPLYVLDNPLNHGQHNTFVCLLFATTATTQVYSKLKYYFIEPRVLVLKVLRTRNDIKVVRIHFYVMPLRFVGSHDGLYCSHLLKRKWMGDTIKSNKEETL